MQSQLATSLHLQCYYYCLYPCVWFNIIAFSWKYDCNKVFNKFLSWTISIESIVAYNFNEPHQLVHGMYGILWTFTTIGVARNFDWGVPQTFIDFYLRTSKNVYLHAVLIQLCGLKYFSICVIGGVPGMPQTTYLLHVGSYINKIKSISLCLK